MGFIDGDAAWYAQEMARRAANRAAQEAAREQARIDREQYEAASSASYRSRASEPAPSGNPFRNLTMWELVSQRDEYVKKLEAAQRSLDGPRERAARDMIDLANYEIDRRNNFHTLSKSERAAMAREQAQQDDELRREYDKLKGDFAHRGEQLNYAFGRLREVKQQVKDRDRELEKVRAELDDAHAQIDLKTSIIMSHQDELERLGAENDALARQRTSLASALDHEHHLRIEGQSYVETRREFDAGKHDGIDLSAHARELLALMDRQEHDFENARAEELSPAEFDERERVEREIARLTTPYQELPGSEKRERLAETAGRLTAIADEVRAVDPEVAADIDHAITGMHSRVLGGEEPHEVDKAQRPIKELREQNEWPSSFDDDTDGQDSTASSF